MQDGLHPAIVLHAVGEAVAEDRHGVAFAERKRQCVFVVRWHFDEFRLLRGWRTAARALRCWFTRLAIKGQVSELAAAFDINRHRLRCLDILDLKHGLPCVIQQTQREIAQTISKAFTSPKTDGFNFMRTTEIDLPPWVWLVLNGVRHAFAVVAAFVAIHRTTRVAAVSSGRLRGFAVLRDVFATAEDFDLGDLKALFVTGDFDTDKARGFTCGDGGLGIHGSGCGFYLDFLLRFLRVVVCGNRAFEASIHLRFDAASVSTASEGVGFGGTDERNVQVSRDLVFQAKRPEDAVHEQAAVTLVRDVFGGAIKRGENAAFLAGGGFVSACPLAGHRRLGGVGGGVRRHAVEWLRHGQNLAGGRFADIASCLHPDVLHAAQDRMLLQRIHDGNASALFVIRAVVTDPRLA